MLTIAGPVIIQGALIELMRNIHEGRKPAGINASWSESANASGG